MSGCQTSEGMMEVRGWVVLFCLSQGAGQYRGRDDMLAICQLNAKQSNRLGDREQSKRIGLATSKLGSIAQCLVCSFQRAARVFKLATISIPYAWSYHIHTQSISDLMLSQLSFNYISKFTIYVGVFLGLTVFSEILVPRVCGSSKIAQIQKIQKI